MLQPEHWWFMAELARHLEITPSSLQRELESLVSSEILLRRQDERRTYFKANTDSPLFPELKGMIERTARIMPSRRVEDEICTARSNPSGLIFTSTVLQIEYGISYLNLSALQKRDY
jgi:hypothetical protein